MTVLVTGANGQLGNEVRIASKNSADRYIFSDIVDASEESVDLLRRLAGEGVSTDTAHLDITNLEQIKEFIKKEDIRVIINCAAYTNVDAAENNMELAEMLNAKAPENLAVAIKEVGGVLIHLSTDYVFGADPYNTPCKEDQKGTPTGIYGLTKLHGEQAIQRVGCDYIIIRTAWLYSEFGKNFVKTMLNLTASKPEIKVVIDQTGTPTYARDLAEAICGIIEGGKYQNHFGVYHYSNEGVCSWYDFTKMIAWFAGISKCDIQPCLSEDYPSPVKRPSYSVLNKSKIKAAFDLKIPYWTESLQKCIDRYRD